MTIHSYSKSFLAVNQSIQNVFTFKFLFCFLVLEWMETNKTLATYIALGAVFVIVLGLLAGGLVWACRRWRCPYPCCCVWRCFQDPVQLREARAYLNSAPRDISWGIRRRWPSLTLQVGLNYIRTCTVSTTVVCYTCTVRSCAFTVLQN